MGGNDDGAGPSSHVGERDVQGDAPGQHNFFSSPPPSATSLQIGRPPIPRRQRLVGSKLGPSTSSPSHFDGGCSRWHPWTNIGGDSSRPI